MITYRKMWENLVRHCTQTLTIALIEWHDRWRTLNEQHFSLKRECFNDFNKNSRKREGLNHSIYNAIQKNWLQSPISNFCPKMHAIRLRYIASYSFTQNNFKNHYMWEINVLPIAGMLSSRFTGASSGFRCQMVSGSYLIRHCTIWLRSDGFLRWSPYGGSG